MSIEPIKTKMIYVIYDTVKEVRKVYKDVYAYGIGPDTEFEKVELGWYVSLYGSGESFCLGYAEPFLQPGDRIKISYEKVEPNAQTI